MKKLLLIPIIATTLLSTGCQKAPTISLKKWLTDIEEDAFTYFSIKDDYKYARFSYRDYEYKVADIIKNNISSLKLQKVTPKVDGDNFIYNLDREIGNHNSLFLLVYENCIIYSANGKDNDERFDEYAEYSISEKDSKAIFEGVNARFKEMDDIFNNTNAQAEKDTTLDNFYAALEKDKDKTAVYYGDDKEVKDASLSLLDDIKDFDFSPVANNDDDTIDYQNRVTYGVRNNFLMEVGKVQNKEYYAARLRYYFTNPGNPFYRVYPSVCAHTYLISNDKAAAFIEKAKAL